MTTSGGDCVDRADRTEVVAIGTLERGIVATVTPAGAVVVTGGGVVDWWVIAEDRVHHPVDEPSVRQRRVDSMPVVETKVRVPSGDVTATAYAVAGVNGVVVELTNSSAAAVAVAFDGGVRSDRPLVAPPAGSSVPGGAAVVPVGHGASARIVLVTDRAAMVPSPRDIASAAKVVRGWLTQLDDNHRMQLPTSSWTAALLAARADVFLAPLPDLRDDPVGYLLSVDARRGVFAANATPGATDIADAAELVARAHWSARRSARGAVPWDADCALRAAARLLARADERAGRDGLAVRARLGETALPPSWRDRPRSPERFVAWTFAQLASMRSDGCVAIVPAFEDAWLGAAIEAHDLDIGTGSVSFAVRWHGERPALLWESRGVAVVTCPALDASWRSEATRGEALLAAPPARRQANA